MDRRSRPPHPDDRLRPPPIPWEYAGKWVALDRTRRHTLASGGTFAEAIANAKAAGHADCILDMGPRPDGASFVGAAWGTPP